MQLFVARGVCNGRTVANPPGRGVEKTMSCKNVGQDDDGMGVGWHGAEQLHVDFYMLMDAANGRRAAQFNAARQHGQQGHLLGDGRR